VKRAVGVLTRWKIIYIKTGVTKDIVKTTDVLHNVFHKQTTAIQTAGMLHDYSVLPNGSVGDLLRNGGHGLFGEPLMLENVCLY